MQTFSALLALCERNSLESGESPSQSPVTRSFVFVDLPLNKQLSKQVNNRDAGDLRRHRAHYDDIEMVKIGLYRNSLSQFSQPIATKGH